MAIIEVDGGRPLKGAARISGSKNGSLPLLASALLSDGKVTLDHVPGVADVTLLCELLRQLGLSVSRRTGGRVELEVEDETPDTAPYELVERMRASICVLGPLVARRGRARIAQPGGCAIGPRPIDIHLRGLEALGAKVRREGGDIEVHARRLRGAEVDLAGRNGPTVLGTCNILSAAVLAEGRTVLTSAAREPEVQALADLLVAMGARISGIGTSRLVIDGVPHLHGAHREIIPDRIEAGTYMMAAAATRGEVLLENVRWEHLTATVEALRSCGVEVERELFGCRVVCRHRPRATQVVTMPYPGFPTDLQAPFMCVLGLAEGKSTITETIFPNRFLHVDELNRFGAAITVSGNTATIEGVRAFSGTRVTARDLRACAAMIVAALGAKGTTHIHDAEHIERGYENVVGKLTELGAEMRWLAEAPSPAASGVAD